MKELTPPDFKQCQAEMPNGENFMTLGGGHKMVRCTNAPTKLLTEKVPGTDGRKGSMTVCNDCFAVFVEQSPADCVEVTPIEKKK